MYSICLSVLLQYFVFEKFRNSSHMRNKILMDWTSRSTVKVAFRNILMKKIGVECCQQFNTVPPLLSQMPIYTSEIGAIDQLEVLQLDQVICKLQGKHLSNANYYFSLNIVTIPRLMAVEPFKNFWVWHVAVAEKGQAQSSSASKNWT